MAAMVGFGCAALEENRLTTAGGRQCRGRARPPVPSPHSYRRARLAGRDRADLSGLLDRRDDVNVSCLKAKPLLYLVPKDMSPA
jgi:hypothetical protein